MSSSHTMDLYPKSCVNRWRRDCRKRHCRPPLYARQRWSLASILVRSSQLLRLLRRTQWQAFANDSDDPVDG